MRYDNPTPLGRPGRSRKTMGDPGDCVKTVVGTFKIMLIIKETIIAKCQTCL